VFVSWRSVAGRLSSLGRLPSCACPSHLTHQKDTLGKAPVYVCEGKACGWPWISNQDNLGSSVVCWLISSSAR